VLDINKTKIVNIFVDISFVPAFFVVVVVAIVVVAVAVVMSKIEIRNVFVKLTNVNPLAAMLIAVVLPIFSVL
jgi:hypothetical protein